MGTLCLPIQSEGGPMQTLIHRLEISLSIIGILLYLWKELKLLDGFS